MPLTTKQLRDLVLASFEAERMSDPERNSTFLHDDFSVVDMVLQSPGNFFPKIQKGAVQSYMAHAFQITDREYIFKHVVADMATQTVIVEFIESYSDPQSKQVYRTPQVAICEIKDEKIFRTRHYMDPRLSFENLSLDQIEKTFS